LTGYCYDGNYFIENQGDVEALNDYDCVTVGLFVNAAKGPLSLGLPNLIWIGGSLTVSENSWLVDFDGMESLEYVGTSITFRDNPNLNNISGFPVLNEIGAHLTIMDNIRMASIGGLEELAQIGGSLIIINNGNILQPFVVSGLGGIQTIEGDLDIEQNPGLEHFGGLGSLSYASTVCVINNGLLTSISGLFGITTTEHIDINTNPQIPDCVVCDFLAGLDELPGNISIYGNYKDECSPAPDNCP
jgi:hypothetical protein